MSANKFMPHLVILAEDDANKDIVNGFTKDSRINSRVIERLHIGKGWGKTINKFEEERVNYLKKYNNARVLLIIDFDEDYENRLKKIKESIPAELSERVFILGVLSEPEKLKTALDHKSYEKIGEQLAEECANNSSKLWNHELLKHNLSELEKMKTDVKPFLFKKR